MPTEGDQEMKFSEFAKTATGFEPYPYQVRIAEEGLPELLDVETGAGKTAAIVLGWLWRRTSHPDAEVRGATPRWLVLCTPLRTLTEQTREKVAEWLENLVKAGTLSEGEVLVHVAMGGSEHASDQWAWKRHPERPAIVIGTLDMLLSRALNRGYVVSRYAWPIDFGLFNNGAHWVFDEVQLMGPGLATSRQLEGLRRELGTVLPCSSTWMSATIDPAALSTFDCPDIREVVRLGTGDRADGALAKRLGGGKVINRLDAADGDRFKAIATALTQHHCPGTLTLAVLNTVRGAQAVYGHLRRSKSEVSAVLLHSRFRPGERRVHVEHALREIDPSGPGLIVVSTQVVEAGVDISATTLVTEAAPWPSIIQRAGRCNRDGEARDARLLWVPIPEKNTAPYAKEDVSAASAELEKLEAMTVTPSSLRDRDVPVARPSWPFLRKVDLLGLFDTAPDISGNDVDVSPFIRDGDDLNAYVAWRDLSVGQMSDQPRVDASELCPVPTGTELRGVIKSLKSKNIPAWRFDHVDGRWVRARPDDARPGSILLFDTRAGAYDPAEGWDPSSRSPVAAVEVSPGDSTDPYNSCGIGHDPGTEIGEWVLLRWHLEDVERAVREMAQGFGEGLIPADLIESAAIAGRVHDIGKAHPVFQASMVRCASDEQRSSIESGGPWAKSDNKKPLRHDRRFFRHELASALMLLGEGGVALRGAARPDLITYLVAAHHGRIRLGIRSVQEEDPEETVLGISSGDLTPATEVPGGEIPPVELSLDTMKLGRDADGTPSWSERALSLRDGTDLGPFRLGFLEALVRLADWRASTPGYSAGVEIGSSKP